MSITALTLNRRRVWIARGALALLLILILVAVLGGAGKTRISHQGDTTSYRPPLLVLVIIGGFSGLVLVAGGLYLCQPKIFWRGVGAVLILMGLYVGSSIPTLLKHKLEVTPDHFFSRIGDWYAPVDNRVEFDSILEMHIERARTSPAGEKNYDLVCREKTEGQEVRIALYDSLKAAMPEIFKRAADRGVYIADSPNGRPIPDDW